MDGTIWAVLAWGGNIIIAALGWLIARMHSQMVDQIRELVRNDNEIRREFVRRDDHDDDIELLRRDQDVLRNEINRIRDARTG